MLSLYLVPCQEYLKPETPSRIQQFGGKGIYLSVNTDFFNSCLSHFMQSEIPANFTVHKIWTGNAD